MQRNVVSVSLSTWDAPGKNGSHFIVLQNGTAPLRNIAVQNQEAVSAYL